MTAVGIILAAFGFIYAALFVVAWWGEFHRVDHALIAARKIGGAR